MSLEISRLLSLILIALGILGVILSFLVPERKKSCLALGLAVLIVLAGLSKWGIACYRDYKHHGPMSRINRFSREQFEKRRDAWRKKIQERKLKALESQKK